MTQSSMASPNGETDPPDQATPVEDGAGRPATGRPLAWAEPATTPIAPWPRRIAKVAATGVCLAVAIVGALVIWAHYISAPWTRDGRVRVQVANVAPQVDGQIVQVHVVDNQFVHKGDVLYVIDSFDFRMKLKSAQATLKQEAADYQVKRQQVQRLLNLSNLSTTAKDQQQAAGDADQAQASLDAAQQQVDMADVNLQRTRVTSPVNGFVSNLLMRVGDWAATGKSNVSVIDTDSFWIDGYFEETKLGRICVGDPAEAQLMGFKTPIRGQVAAVGRGISVSNAEPSTQGLPSVDAVYTWVRLAQRVPVRLKITEVPVGVPLISGLTATVTVRKDADAGNAGLLRSIIADVHDVFAPEQQRSPTCIPATVGDTGAIASIPEPKPAPPEPAQQIDPGVANSMTAKPQQP